MLYIDVLDAYRADLASAQTDSFTDADATWLEFASALQRALGLRAEERDRYLRAALAKLDLPFEAGLLNDAGSLLFRNLTQLANDAEQAGAFAVATTMLDAGQALLDGGEDRWRGRMLWQQARILRKLGEVDRAQDLLVQLKQAGAEVGDPSLVALSWIGLGGVARVRGNYPDARRAFTSALALATRTDPELEIRRYGEHGLLVSAAAAGDFDIALKYGIAALEHSTSDEQRAEILSNLAAVCYDAGETQAALHTFVRVLGCTCTKRVRLSALGGAAVAAARLGKPRMVERLAAVAEDMIRNERGFAHEIADLSRELYESFALLGEEERAARYRRDALRAAETHGYHEITHRIETFSVSREAAPSSVELGAGALGVARSLAAGDAEAMLATAMTQD